MVEFGKTIFGKAYRFTATAQYAGLLRESIRPYPDAHPETWDVEVRIDEADAADERILSQNPRIFSRCDASFVTDFGRDRVRWRMGDDGNLSVCLSPRAANTGAWRSLRGRWRSKEFATPVEHFEQVLHELVLVPSTFFATDRIPLHAAAVCVAGRAVLVSGTGGTGKTTALLSLRNEPGVSFVSDDICVLSAGGAVFANLAWPKVYGYNVVGNDLRSLLLARRGWLDRLHFDLKNSIDPARVRRKIEPHRLFGAVETAAVPVSTVLILARSDVPRIVVEPVDAAAAARASVAVMKTEYFTFFRFLLWGEFNDLLDSRRPLLMDDMTRRWTQQLEAILASREVKLVRIPMAVRHEEYVQSIKALILNGRLR